MLVEIDGFLIHDVTVEEYEGKDKATGGLTYAPPVGVKARIEPTRERTTDDKGNEFVSRGRIFFAAGTRMATGSKITFGGGAYILASLSPCYGFGEHHVEGLLK